MSKSLLQRLKIGADVLPTCADYAELLMYYHRLTGEFLDSLRDKYGLYTYKEWAVLVNI